MLPAAILLVSFAPSLRPGAPASRPVSCSDAHLPLLRRIGVPVARTDEPSRMQRHIVPAAAAGAVLLVPAAAHAAGLAAASTELSGSIVQALSLIFVSELGDKTFFIAALLAARASKLLTFAGCAGALYVGLCL